MAKSRGGFGQAATAKRNPRQDNYDEPSSQPRKAYDESAPVVPKVETMLHCHPEMLAEGSAYVSYRFNEIIHCVQNDTTEALRRLQNNLTGR